MNTPILLQIATGLNLGEFKFQQESNPLFTWVFVGLVVVGTVYGFYYIVTRRARMREQALAREETRLRLMLTEFSLTEQDRKLMETIAGSDVAAQIIPIVSARGAFEQAAALFREAHPEHPAIKRVPQLRQRLGYGFSNPRNPFTSTRMLPPGLHVRCGIPRGAKQIQFLTTLLGVGERAFFIRPPMAKGKPVNLSRVPELVFKVTRENDAEYEFNAKVLGQTQTGMNAVALDHTASIRKLLFRGAPRIPVELDVHFFVIRQEVAAERKHRTFKRHESQYSILGRILDLSQGGLRLQAELPGQRPVEGDIIVFQLPQANIKDDLVAEVIDVAEPKQDWLQLHLQFVGTKEINRLKMSKFLQDKGGDRELPAPPAGGGADGDTPPAAETGT